MKKMFFFKNNFLLTFKYKYILTKISQMNIYIKNRENVSSKSEKLKNENYEKDYC